MDFWFFVVVIVIVGSLTELGRLYLKKREVVSPEYEKKIDDLQTIVTRQNTRIENLETVILEMERNKKFDDLKK